MDTHGGHHDAGDYSKYTIDVAQLSHNLLFAVDSLPGVAQLDNLGFPKAGNGVPDVLEEAMWEIDFLSRLQDADGGFYFLVYPRDRQYEADVSLLAPNLGDPQVVFPKTTTRDRRGGRRARRGWLLTLGEAVLPGAGRKIPRGSESGMAIPAKCVRQIRAARLLPIHQSIWRSLRARGRNGLGRRRPLCATGDAAYQTELMSHYDPSDPNTIYWSWWRMFDAYGCAVRDYAFAARSGRLQPSQLNAAYLAKCEQQIVLCGDDNVCGGWVANASAYRNSFSPAYKGPDNAGWFFSVNQTFDLAVANVVSNKQAYIDAMVGNMNYEAGCNPVNMGFVTGVAWKRQNQIVSQYADNTVRSLPPTGIPVSSVQGGFTWLSTYGTENSALTFPNDYPNDNGSGAPYYAPYDRWADTFNTTTELISPQQGRSLAAHGLPDGPNIRGHAGLEIGHGDDHESSRRGCGRRPDRGRAFGSGR